MHYVFQTPDQSLPLFVESIGYHWLQDAMNRKTGYPYVHWLQTESGSGEVDVCGNRFILGPHSGILFNAEVPHRYQPLGGEWRTAYFTFGGELVASLLPTLVARKYLLIKSLATPLDTFVQTHAQTLQGDDPAQRLANSALVYQFCLLMRQTPTKALDAHVAADIIQPIKALIEQDYAKPITNADLVALTHYSEQYLTAGFRRYYGLTPKQLLTNVRVRHAKELLLNQPALSVAQVASAVGFPTTSYFIAQFKAVVKVTPGQFRQWYQ